ncbi:hypothetical protein ASG92_23560 [Arthrobacter sp. Soil736]|nr:hypothetical protein ASG92_23560 [Arthrobacter sp. Soil736]
MVSDQVPASVIKKAFTVLGFRQNESGTLLKLQRLDQKAAAEEWVTPLHIALPVGQLVFVHDGWLSYVDEGLTEVVKIPIQLRRLLPEESIFGRLRKWWNS